MRELQPIRFLAFKRFPADDSHLQGLLGSALLIGPLCFIDCTVGHDRLEDVRDIRLLERAEAHHLRTGGGRRAQQSCQREAYPSLSLHKVAPLSARSNHGGEEGMSRREVFERTRNYQFPALRAMPNATNSSEGRGNKQRRLFVSYRLFVREGYHGIVTRSSKRRVDRADRRPEERQNDGRENPARRDQY